ncbi:MAG: ATP-binding cassette domain-containing protein [Pirellulaceae bacterium]
MSNATNLAIATHDLCRFFESQCAVDHVNLEVVAGTFYGFLGPNGAGKSTTIKMLTGLLEPSAGEIRVLGFDPRDRRQSLEIKRQIGVVPENLALFDNLTAREYLTFVGRMFLLDRQTITRSIGRTPFLFTLDREEKIGNGVFARDAKKTGGWLRRCCPIPNYCF